MREDKDKITRLYDTFVADGYDMESEDDFRKNMSDAKKRKAAYDALVNDGYEMEPFGEFENNIGYGSPKHSSESAPVPASSRPERPQGRNPTGQEKRAMQHDLSQMAQRSKQMTQRSKQMTDAFHERMNNMREYGMGLGMEVKEGKKVYNPESGKFEQTYLTPVGNRYNSKALADAEQRQIKDAMERELHPVEAELRDAYVERDRLNKLADERIDELERDYKERPWWTKLGEYANSDKMPDAGSPHLRWGKDTQYTQYMAALRKNQELITMLEDARDKRTNEFWHSLGKEITNGYTFSLAGKSRLDDVASLAFAQRHINTINKKRQKGELLTKEEQAAEAVLKNAEWDNRVQGQYGDQYGAWARAGKMGAVSADLMTDFLLMGGQPLSLAKNVAGSVGKVGTRLFGEAATKGFGKFMVKATGATVGSMVAGAEIANTIGIGRTMADAAGRYMGDVMQDEDGNFVFGHFEDDGQGGRKLVEGGDSFLGAVLGAERSAIAENASEIAGEFIPGSKFLLKGMEKIGLSKIASYLTSLGGKQWYKAYSKSLEAMGFHGVPGEALEEYVGTGFDALMGGDEWKNLADKRTHIDIWLGCATMGALLNAPRAIGTGTQMAQYYRYKHNADKASARASIQFGTDTWEPLREKIDGATNEQITDVLLGVLDDESLNDEQKKAVADYAGNLQRMRGYSLGRVSTEDRTEETARPTQQEADNHTLNRSYAEGYSLETAQEMNDAKNMLDYQRQRMIEVVGANEESLEDGVIDWLNEAGNAPAGSERRQTILDYLNAKQVYDGMIQRVRDDIDGRIEQSDVMIDSRTNRATGMIQGATMKQDDRKVYVVYGNIAPYADGTGVDIHASDESIIVRDAETGTLEQVSPDAVLSVEEAQDPSEQKRLAADAIRLQLAQEAAGKIDGIVSFNPGDTYTLEGEDGEQIQIQVTANGEGIVDNGDGTVNVTDGANVFQVAKDVIQQAADAANLARVEEFEKQRAAEEMTRKQAAEEAAKPQYAMNDLITLRDGNGNSVRGSITADADADGRYEVYTEDAVNGKRVNLFTRDELDNMIVEHNGQAIENVTRTSDEKNRNTSGTRFDQVGLEEENGTLVSPSVSVDKDSARLADMQVSGAENVEPVSELPASDTASSDKSFVQTDLEDGSKPADTHSDNQRFSFRKVTNSASEKQENGTRNGVTALERIPKDEQGNPVYEQAETPDLAWDAIVEKTGGNEEMAQTVADGMVADKEAALKKIEKAKPKGGRTVEEKIAAEKERKAAVDAARQELDIWQKIAQTTKRRKIAAESERRRIATEQAAHRRAEEEKLRAEREEAERKEREALNGVPDMVDDTPQDARARGYRRVSGHKYDRQAPVPGLQGKKVSVKFGDGIIPTGNIAVIESRRLQPSHIAGQRNPLHFIDEAQPKERNDEASVLSAEKIARNIRPEEITSSVTAFTGAPTVNARGEAIQGNNRSDALRRMWESHPDQAVKYKQYLKDHADEFGLYADDIEAMERPVLVNMLDVEDADAITLGQYVAQDTESGGTERIKPKNAVQKMGADMRTFANLLLSSSDEETSFAGLVDNNGGDVLAWMNRKGYITPTQYKSAFDSKGNLTAEAKNDLKGIMYQSIFQNGNTRLEDMFNAMPAKAQRAILATAYRDYDSPNAERMVEEIQNSIRAYNALSQDEAFVSAKNWKETRMAVEAWKRQYAMDDVTGESYLPADKFSNFALHLATMYKGESQSLIQGTFNQLYDLIQGTQEETLFEKPDNTPRTLIQAIKETLNIDYNGQQRSNVLAGGSAAGREREQGSAGASATGERVEGGEQSTDSGEGITGNSGEGRPSREDQGRSEETDHLATEENRQEKQAEYTLSTQKSGNGENFYQDESGNINLVNIPQEVFDEIGYSKAPLRLTPSMMLHVLNSHGKELGISSVDEAVKFVLDVMSNFDHVRLGYDGALIFSIENGRKRIGKRAITILINSENGQFYGLKTSGYETINGLNKRPLLWERGAKDVSSSTDAASASVSTGKSPLSGEQSGSASHQSKGLLKDKELSLHPMAQIEESVPLNDSNKPTSTDNQPALLGINSSELNTSFDSKGTNNSRKSNELGEKIAKAEAEVNTEPTPAQAEAGNYKKGHVTIGEFDITIENPAGSTRKGVDADGKEWSTTMANTYGYIKGTEGVDGDHIDVFLSNDIDGWNGRKAFVVDQTNTDGSFDEHKVMLGFNDKDEAMKAYLANYDATWEKTHPGLRISETDMEDFNKWVQSSHRKTKPFTDYSTVRKVTADAPASVEQTDGNRNGEDLFAIAERIAKEDEIRRTAAHFPMETPEEAASFDKRVQKMSDEELLAYMREDGNGNVNKAHHPSVYDEYDDRHGDEILASYDEYLPRLADSNTTKEQAEEMLANLQTDKSVFATDERPLLLGQEEALQDYIAELENKEAESDAEQHGTETSEVTFNPSGLRLRKLEDGETCHVERVYEESRMFDFTGKDRIESEEDVAFIFRQLENAAVENSFLVLVKDGVPTVIHLGMGNYSSVMAPFEQAFVAYSELKPDKVYFVHNHPSGALKASLQDQGMIERIKEAFGEDVVMPGIIIDTTSGKYGLFGMFNGISIEKDIATAKGDEVPIKVYHFGKQVFAPDWNPKKSFKVTSSDDVAAFVSSHRLGEHKKMSFLVMGNDGSVVANVFLPWTKLSDIDDLEDACKLMAGYVHQCGGVRGVLYGNYDYTAADGKLLNKISARMNELGASLLDAIHIDHSANDEGVLREPGADVDTSTKQKRAETMEDVNRKFNEELETLTPENADRIILSLGRPSAVLRAGGVQDKPMKLYGNKVIKKMKKHGFKLSELHNLPEAVANPIAVFNNYQKEGNRSVLTELQTEQGNFLVTLSVGKDADIDFNIVSSVFGKGNNNITDWINDGFLTYINKEKAHEFLSHQSAPIAATAANSELSSATKVVENFENPALSDENLYRRVGNAQTISPRQLRKQMAERAKELADALHLDNVDVVASVSGLKDGKKRAKGFYTKSTGKITIVIPNHTGLADVEQTLLHEAVAHYGLRQLFGEHFDTFLDNVLNNADESIRRRIVDMATKNGWDFRKATEEYLAGLAERTNFEEAQKTGWWQRIKRFFSDMLDKLGFPNLKGVTLSDNELRYILWRSYENLKDGNRSSLFNEAADIAMQYELGVGEYADSPKAVNERFNEELKRYEKGEMGRNEYIQVGNPMGIMRNFMPDVPIILRQKVVTKANNKHKLIASEIKDLPKSLANPIFVFKSRKNTISVLTELKSNKGQNIFVAMELGTSKQMGHEFLEVNDITTIHGRETDNIVNPILENGTLRYVNKEKGIKWLSSAKSNSQAIATETLSTAAKIVENFENPKIGDGNDVLFRDGAPVMYERQLARDRYDNRMKSGMYQSREALQDSMLSLKEAMLMIDKRHKHIEDVEGFENAYLGENRLSSVNQAEADAFAHLLFKPMLEEVARLARNEAERVELTDYMMAKHGLERNRDMAERDAQKDFEEHQKKHPQSKKTLQDFIGEYRKRDYAGLTALTGMDNVADAEAEARAMVDEYESAHDTAPLWEKVNAVSKAILSKQYECGMMSKETYENVRDMYAYYIPLRGFDEKTSGEAYAYLTHRQSAFNAPIKKAEGRRSKADDPFANLQSMAESTIMQGNRNRLVKQKFLNFVLNHPSDLVSVSDLWLEYDAVADEWKPVFPNNIEDNDTPDVVEQKMKDFEDRMRQLAESDPGNYKHGKDTANIPYRVVDSRDLRKHQVVVKRNGRDYVITVNGKPRLAQALNGQTNPDNDISGVAGKITKASERVNRHLSAVYTTRNPDFVVSNFVRDMLYTNSMVWIKESPNYALRFHRNVAKANIARMKILLAKHRKGTLDMDKPIEAMFHQFMMNGGETGYTNIRDIEQHKNDIRRELKKANGKLKVSRAWDLLGERFDELNRAVENSARFAAYMTSREMGRTIDRAIYDAKEISVNFNKKGSGAKFLGANGQTRLGDTSAFLSGVGRSSYVFWNAAIQGTANFGRQMKRHPAKALTGAAAMFVLGAVIAYLGGSGDDGDDDDKNAYYNLPEHVRRSNILFRAGNHWISLPLPVEYRALYGMGELMTSVISGKEHPTGGEIASAIAGQATQMLPIDFLEGGGGLNAFVPSAAKPLWEAYVAEKSWTGMPLYKNTPYNKDMPEWTKAYKSANKHIVNLAATLNEMTGGDSYTKGAIDDILNPAKVEYLLNGYFGGVFGTIDKLAKTGETILGDREYDPRNILLVNRLVKAGDERTEYRAVNNEYFRLKEEHDRVKSRLKHYENDTDKGIFDYAEKIDFLYNSPEYERYEIFEDYRRDIDGLYDELKDVADDDERKQVESELNALKKEMIEEMEKTRKRK